MYEDARGSIAGCAHLHICMDALEGFRPFGVVERVVVSTDTRGKGYGSQLINAIEDLCKQRQCVKLMLTSNARRLQAHDFYRRLGCMKENHDIIIISKDWSDYNARFT